MQQISGKTLRNKIIAVEAVTFYMRGSQGWRYKSTTNLQHVRYLPVWASFSSLRPSPTAKKNRKKLSSVFLPLSGAPAPGGHKRQKHQCHQTHTMTSDSVYPTGCPVHFSVSLLLFCLLSLY